jgi:predicted hydrocarbon binding protein
MIEEKKEIRKGLSKKNVMKLKGQAVPLLSYHIIRDHVLPSITGEFQSSILYWAGRNIASEYTFQTFEDVMDLYLEMGWGLLEVTQSNNYVKSFKLNSPYFSSRNVTENESTFALECGFLAEALSQLEQKDTEGEFKVVKKPQEFYVSFSIYLQDKVRD